MPNIDDLWPEGDRLTHVKAREWSAKLAEPGVGAVVEVARTRTTVGWVDPIQFLFFSERGATIDFDQEPWDAVLNRQTVRGLGLRAVSLGNEALRQMLGLSDDLESLKHRYGRGFFSSVLVELLGESDLRTRSELGRLLNVVQRNRPAAGPSREQCAAGIEATLRATMLDLSSLGYGKAEAAEILSAALVWYLDETFHISDGISMGFYPGVAAPFNPVGGFEMRVQSLASSDDDELAAYVEESIEEFVDLELTRSGRAISPVYRAALRKVRGPGTRRSHWVVGVAGVRLAGVPNSTMPAPRPSPAGDQSFTGWTAWLAAREFARALDTSLERPAGR